MLPYLELWNFGTLEQFLRSALAAVSILIAPYQFGPKLQHARE